MFEKNNISVFNKEKKESKIPKSIDEIDSTLKEMDKIHNTSFYEWIKDENNAGVIAFKTKSLFQENYEKNPEIVYNVLRFLCKDWKLSKIAEIMLKLFYKCNIASKSFAEVVCEVSFMLNNPEKVDLISLLLIGEESKNVAYFLFYYFKHTEKHIRMSTEITDKEDLLDELNAFSAGVLECLYTCLKWNEDYFRELLLEYVILSTTKDDERREFLVRMVNVKYQRFQKDLQSEIHRKKNLRKIIDCVEDDAEIDKLEEMEKKMEEENKLIKKSIDFGILIFNMFQTVMRTEIEELTTLSTPVSATPPTNILRDNTNENNKNNEPVIKNEIYKPNEENVKNLNREESDSTLYEEEETNNSNRIEVDAQNQNINESSERLITNTNSTTTNSTIEENENYINNNTIYEEVVSSGDDYSTRYNSSINLTYDSSSNNNSSDQLPSTLSERRRSSLRITIPSFNSLLTGTTTNSTTTTTTTTTILQNNNNIPSFQTIIITSPISSESSSPTTTQHHHHHHIPHSVSTTTIDISSTNNSNTIITSVASTTTTSASLMLSPTSSIMTSLSPSSHLSLTLSTSVGTPSLQIPPSPPSNNNNNNNIEVNPTSQNQNQNQNQSQTTSLFQFGTDHSDMNQPNYNQILLKDEVNNNNTTTTTTTTTTITNSNNNINTTI